MGVPKFSKKGVNWNGGREGKRYSMAPGVFINAADYGLGQSPAAVDHEHLAGDETRVWVAKEADGMGDIMDAAHPADRDARKDGLTELGFFEVWAGSGSHEIEVMSKSNT
jgi:hypothetical protein